MLYVNENLQVKWQGCHWRCPSYDLWDWSILSTENISLLSKDSAGSVVILQVKELGLREIEEVGYWLVGADVVS